MNLILACTIIIMIESIFSSIALQQSEGVLGTGEVRLTYRFCFALPSTIPKYSSQNYTSEELQKLQVLRALPLDLLVEVLVIDHKTVLNCM